MSNRPANPKRRLAVRFLAGAYLFYLAWSLRGELTHFSPLTLAPILFVVVGGVFAGTAIYGIYFRPEDPDEDSSSSDDSTHEEDKP